MLHSDYRYLGMVTLPPYQARQKYMHTFDLASPVMAEGYEDYLSVVRQLCAAAGATEGLAHMTVDEKAIQPGMSQRRPGLHVDGCFVPAAQQWGHPPSPGWNHYCNNTGLELGRMPVIVAASIAGCRCYRGTFNAVPTSDGDLEHLRAEAGDGEILFPKMGYLLSPDCVHESLRMPFLIERQFLRIALPNTFPFQRATHGRTQDH